MTHSEKSPFTSILRGRMDLSFIFSFNFSNFSPIISSISSSSSSFCFFIKSEIANKVSPEINTEGFRVKERNFAKRRIFKSTDVYARMGKAKSRHDMDTAGVIVDIDTAQVRHWLDTGYDRQCYPCSEFWLRSAVLPMLRILVTIGPYGTVRYGPRSVRTTRGNYGRI